MEQTVIKTQETVNDQRVEALGQVSFSLEALLSLATLVQQLNEPSGPHKEKMNVPTQSTNVQTAHMGQPEPTTAAAVAQSTEPTHSATATHSAQTDPADSPTKPGGVA